MNSIIIYYNNNSPLTPKLMSHQPFILFNKHLYSTYFVKLTMLSILQILTHFLWLRLRYSFNKTLLYLHVHRRYKIGRKHHLCSWDASSFVVDIRYLTNSKRICDNTYKKYYFLEEDQLALCRESVWALRKKQVKLLYHIRMKTEGHVNQETQRTQV